MSELFDVVVVGAGIAGLTCAQILQQAGYQVVVVEKSRGVGGRLATKRLSVARADHGTCYISPKDEVFRAFIQALVQRDVVQVWTDCVHQFSPVEGLQIPSERSPRYVAAEGMSAIAKALLPGLFIQLNQRVTGLRQTEAQAWELTVDHTSEIVPEVAAQSHATARAVVLTAPAPQSLELVAPLPETVCCPDGVAQLRTVEFSPCIAVMAGYRPELLADWQRQYADVRAIAATHPVLGWIGLDSSKRRTASQPIFVLQSTAPFAQAHLDDFDLESVGSEVLRAAGEFMAPWLAQPEWMQVHRWRYALSTRPLAHPYVVLNAPVPLLCAGDWCGGMRVENAFLSGLEAAAYINQQLDQRAISPHQFWHSMA